VKLKLTPKEGAKAATLEADGPNLVLRSGSSELARAELSPDDQEALASMPPSVIREFGPLRLFNSGEELHISLTDAEDEGPRGYWAVPARELTEAHGERKRSRPKAAHSKKASGTKKRKSTG
jgi:hypothetical protein